ncbi:hypothetical protein AAFF_G00394630 [Aldrovandia affinis]|uniref:Uncharacterized protein n=1 Tax=Aldrovandia affinis TaxID=143900 RepID=A0AAD7WLR0_9TELE|nr:hypothetical protein AAFF_G00394630 [Aldrovandia affinis]
MRFIAGVHTLDTCHLSVKLLRVNRPQKHTKVTARFDSDRSETAAGPPGHISAPGSTVYCPRGLGPWSPDAPTFKIRGARRYPGRVAVPRGTVSGLAKLQQIPDGAVRGVKRRPVSLEPASTSCPLRAACPLAELCPSPPVWTERRLAKAGQLNGESHPSPASPAVSPQRRSRSHR